jgi:hypothetical protein
VQTASSSQPQTSTRRSRATREIEWFRKAFPDLTYTVVDQVAEGDKVVTRNTASGTDSIVTYELTAEGTFGASSEVASDAGIEGRSFLLAPSNLTRCLGEMWPC